MAGTGIKLLDSATTPFTFSYHETTFQGHHSLHYVVTKHYDYIQINNMIQFTTDYVCVMQEYGSLVAEKNRTRGWQQ
jgi:hypothetical protein